MENQENDMREEEMINREQFQAGSAAGDEQRRDDSEYTEQEIQFADGEGTQLEEEFDVPDKEDLEDELDSDLDESEFEEAEDQ